MTERCHACGQTIPQEDVSDEAARLFALLSEGHHPRRSVYVGRGSCEWYVTYGGGKFSADAVHELVRRGAVRSCYSDCLDMAYHVGPTLDIAATNEARWRGDRRALVYVQDDEDSTRAEGRSP